jgi:hypothetical protein
MTPALSHSSRLGFGVIIVAASKELLSETSPDGSIETPWLDPTSALAAPMNSGLPPYVLTLVLVLLLPSL